MKGRYGWIVFFVMIAFAEPLVAQTPQQLLLAHFEKQTQLQKPIRKVPLRLKRNPIQVPFYFLLWVYQSQITHQLATNCPYHPSCSEFAKQAIQEFGALKGVLLAADRLTRCTAGNIRQLKSPTLLPTGKISDPPSAYRLKP